MRARAGRRARAAPPAAPGPRVKVDRTEVFDGSLDSDSRGGHVDSVELEIERKLVSGRHVPTGPPPAAAGWARG